MSNFGPSLFGPAVFGGEPVPHLYLQIDAEMTTLARRYTARGHTDGTVLQIDNFTVGQGGFDPLDYFAALPVNPDTIDSLVDPVFTDAVDYIEWANTRSIVCYCLLEAPDAAGAYLGEIGIYATVANSPGGVDDGKVVLYAIGHFPMVTRPPDLGAVSSARVVLRVSITT
jgi:hypothetical protein